MKTLLTLITLFLPALLYSAVPSRFYYEQANEPRFDEIELGMLIEDVNKICGGRPYSPFETVRGGFAFAVDENRSGILALPWHIDLNQTVDFFTSKKRVLVVFYKDRKAHGLMVFDFATSRWDNRSRAKEPAQKEGEPGQPGIPSAQAPRFFRAYALSDLSPQIQVKAMDAERRLGVVVAPASITPPQYREKPRPFSFEIRRAKKKVWITVFALIDEHGDTVSCEVLDATDDQVAREAGPIMCAAKYRPAMIGAKPVPSACTFTSTGGYVPVSR